jgi:hypothetical protein
MFFRGLWSFAPNTDTDVFEGLSQRATLGMGGAPPGALPPWSNINQEPDSEVRFETAEAPPRAPHAGVGVLGGGANVTTEHR